MGGSLGLALKKRGGWRVLGLARRKATLREARRRGAIDEGSTEPDRVLPLADAVVLCSPVDKIVPLARAYRRYLKPDALLMDVGSVKDPIVRSLETLFAEPNGPVFVGVHPMAGSEKTGVANAHADLYRGAICAITPTRRTPPRRVAEAARFWKSVGANVLFIDPAAHDRAVAMVSHLPHLIADALMRCTADAAGGSGGTELLHTLAAGSFRDATRVAGADPALWRGIFTLNDGPVRQALRLFQKELVFLAGRRWTLPALRQAQKLNAEFRSGKTR